MRCGDSSEGSAILYAGDIDDNLSLTKYLDSVMIYILELRRKYAL
jgi:hypothetical protein